MMTKILNEEPKTETQLGDLLPKYVTRVLARNGITTVEGVRKAYPHDLLKIWGLGLLRFKQIETALFPGQFYMPERIYDPISRVKGSSLNGVLSPATVQALARGGVLAAEQLVDLEPAGLLKIRGLGIAKLREIEKIFFPSQKYEPPRVRQPAPTLRDSTGKRLKNI